MRGPRDSARHGRSAGSLPQCLLKQGLETRVETTAATVLANFVPPTAAELARHFPQLDILELMGQGGMGAVYKARQKGLDRVVALKILPPAAGRDAAFAERFTREARALARLTHPNIVTVHDFGQAGEYFYFLMRSRRGHAGALDWATPCVEEVAGATLKQS